MKTFISLSLLALSVTTNALKCFPSPNENCTGPFEEYQECGTACPITCENKDYLPMICTMQCVAGCFCQEGYVRNSHGICILPKKCPKPEPLKCGKNENYVECSTRCREATCETKRHFYCGVGCQQRCHCNDGYVRDGNNVCIKEEECPVQPSCPANEEYSECGANGCQNTCANPTLSQVCRGTCMAGCVCREGFLRDENGICVLASSCTQQPSCARDFEEYNSCGTACPLTCENKDNPPAFCTDNCVDGCFCKAGYVRDNNGNCVLPENCPV